MSSSSPRGVRIGKGWKVGPQIGSGACAVVCELLTTNGGKTQYVVKLAPLPTRTTKNGKSKPEQDVSLLRYEAMIYQTQFQSLLGKTIPAVPLGGGGPPVTGDSDGWKFFVMEKMESTINGVVPLLLGTSTTKKMLNLGPIAVRMLDCVREIHERNNIIRDVKSENFMLAIAGKGKGSTGSSEKALASRVRLIDLALAAQWTPSYRESSEAGSIVGTPLYASINVHDGQKASFRDDLEALAYILAEITHQVASGDNKLQLPWAQGRDDHDIGNMKKAQVNNHMSEFYRRMGERKTVSVLSKFLAEVQSYKFKQRPNYETLSQILSKLEVSRPTTAPSNSSYRAKQSAKRGRSKAPPAAAVPAAAAAATINLVDDTDSDDDDAMDWEYTDENVQPKTGNSTNQSTGKMTARAQRAARRNHRQGSSSDMIVVDDDDDENSETKNAAAPTSRKKQKKATSAHKSTVAKRGSKSSSQPATAGGVASGLRTVGVVFEVLDGPHEGETFTLQSGGDEKVVVGTNPSGKSMTGISFKKDRSLNASHMTLELSVKRNVASVIVVNKSKGDLAINRHAVPTSSRAFMGDKILLGETVLGLQSLK